MSLSLPKILNYNSDLPVDVHSNLRYGVCSPINGTSFTQGQEIVINIPRAGTNCFMLPSYNKLRFKLSATTTAITGLCGSVNSIISSLEVRHSGMQLEYISSYETLFNTLLDSQVSAADRADSYSITNGTSATYGTQTGDDVATGGTYFLIHLISGIVGTLSNKAFPVNILGGNLELRLVLNSAVEAALQVTAANGFTVTDVEFQMCYVQLPDQLAATISREPLSYHTRTYSNIEKTVAANTTVLEELLPYRYSSLNTIILAMRTQSLTTTWGAATYASSRNTNEIATYCFKVGGKMIPTNYVKAYGYNYVEPFEKLREAFHLSNSASVPCIHNSTSWVKTANTDGTGTFCIIQDFETMQQLSDQIVSGEDTRNADVQFSATFNAAGVAAIQLFEYFAEYNVTFVIENGMITKLV